MSSDSDINPPPCGDDDLESVLGQFLPPTRLWFQDALGAPTPPQVQGWPAIQRGDNTLILAPTGSGKTLSAFLWGIDQLFRKLGFDGTRVPRRGAGKNKRVREVRSSESAEVNGELRLLYISPLKALNNDIERNLRSPLAGIRECAGNLGLSLPEIRVAVRSGDTPQRERQAMVRKPPHILITTPESLYLMLTGPKARQMFRTVRTVIVDEIHTLAGSKRGVHLALSLERLQQIAANDLQRIGLSATIQPLDEVARYLGGHEWKEVPEGAPNPALPHPDTVAPEGSARPALDEHRVLVPRPVTIVDAAYQKELDLLVETVESDFQNLPGDSVWPSIIPRTVELINAHRSTLIFVNNRRLAERTADRLNEQIAAQEKGVENALLGDGYAKGLGMMAPGTGEAAAVIRSHHGSLSKEVRLQLEQELKAGQLPALVGTSSLELGIDIGAIDLVVQYHSPKTVAEGLQRVGRSGHLVGQTSKGRIFPTHSEDVMEAAAVAGGMLRGEVEPTHTPHNPLDILAQQIVAMVSVEDWSVEALYDLIRQCYAYQNLTLRTFKAVLDMLSGRYPSEVHRSLRARLVWDKVNNQLSALPGTRLLALNNGGAITDRGSFGAYLGDGKTKLGELDEEFVYESRVGDTFILGSQVWRVIDLTDDKVTVTEAPGATPRMPFWRGDFAWRPYDLGARVGAFRRAVAARVLQVVNDLTLPACRAIAQKQDEPSVRTLVAWLQASYALDVNSAWHVIDYVGGQLDHAGAISSDKTILVEAFEDAIGDHRMVIQAPFGGRVNGLWALALAGALREQSGVEAEIQANDEGILLRFSDADADFPLEIVTEMSPALARRYILQELPNSAVFGAQFRQNAARALLLPGLGAGKRTPFWLQRLRAKDLLQAVRHLDDFPIVAETYRDCLEEVMDLPGLEKVLEAIQRGEIAVVPLESLTPSPVANSLLWNFIEHYMYEWDAPKTERQLQTASLNRDLLQDLLQDIDLSELLRTEAVDAVRGRLQHTALESQARSAAELSLIFQNLGDLSTAEIAERSRRDVSDWIAQLAGAQRILQFSFSTEKGTEKRWIHAEYESEYRRAFSKPTQADSERQTDEQESARRTILQRYLSNAGPIARDAILARYGFPREWLIQELDRLLHTHALAQGRFTPAPIDPLPTARVPEEADAKTGNGKVDAQEFVDRRTLEQMHRRTLTILRNEVRPVPFTAYVDFITHWQFLHPDAQLRSPGALQQVLQKLRAAPIVGRVWERDILPLRLVNYRPHELAELCQRGEVVWVGDGGADPQRGRIQFFYRGEGRAFLSDPSENAEMMQSENGGGELSQTGQKVYEFLKSEGAIFLADLRAGLDLSTEAAEAALVELAMRGLVTNDSISFLRTRPPRRVSSRPSVPPQLSSSLEAQLAERMGKRETWIGGSRRPKRRDYRAAKQRVQKRLNRQMNLDVISPAPATGGIPSADRPGRWTLVHRIGVLGKEISPPERVARQVRQLLLRYGVVTRKCLEHEGGSWVWQPIYQELQRLEMRGEVRRGYFVQGLPGVQFALPEVVEQLRSRPARHEISTKPLVLLNACDPANLFPMADITEDDLQSEPLPAAFDGAPLRFARLPSTWLVLEEGRPVLLIEESGGSITTVDGVNDDVTERALQVWARHLLSSEKRIRVQRWNGEPVLNSGGQPLLEGVGFYRDYPHMTKERDPHGSP